MNADLSPSSRPRLVGLGFNLICALYFVTLGSLVSGATQVVMSEGTAATPWLGALLLLFVVVETWALPRKMKLVLSNLEDGESTGGLRPLDPDTGISILVLFVAVGAFGWNLNRLDTGSQP